MAEPWRIELPGGLRATRGDRIVTRFRSQKNAALLAYLALRSRYAHPRGARGRAGRARARLLAAAAALYQGELLPGFFDLGIVVERQRDAEAHLVALQQLAAATGAFRRARVHPFPVPRPLSRSIPPGDDWAQRAALP